MYQDRLSLMRKGKNQLQKKIKEVSQRFTIASANEKIDTLNRQQGTNIKPLSRETMQLNRARDILQQQTIKRDARQRRKQNRQRFLRGN